MSSLLNTIKKAGLQAADASVPVSVQFAVVTDAEPLAVKVDQRFTLYEEFLIIPERLRGKLALGDSLILLRVQGGQQFIVLDRGVAG